MRLQTTGESQIKNIIHISMSKKLVVWLIIQSFPVLIMKLVMQSTIKLIFATPISRLVFLFMYKFYFRWLKI